MRCPKCPAARRIWRKWKNGKVCLGCGTYIIRTGKLRRYQRTHY